MLPPSGGFWDGTVSRRGEELQLLLDGAVTQGPQSTAETPSIRLGGLPLCLY